MDAPLSPIHFVRITARPVVPICKLSETITLRP
jgi:hypothetical protein